MTRTTVFSGRRSPSYGQGYGFASTYRAIGEASMACNLYAAIARSENLCDSCDRDADARDAHAETTRLSGVGGRWNKVVDCSPAWISRMPMSLRARRSPDFERGAKTCNRPRWG